MSRNFRIHCPEITDCAKGTGYIIVSAVCDEKAGIAAAVPSIEPWLMDANRFSTKWREAVQAKIEGARLALA